MKQLYTSLLTGAALLVAGAVSAQSAGHGKSGHANRSAIVNPAARPAHVAGDEFRGTAPPNDLCGSVSIDALTAGGTLTYNGTTIGATNTGDAVAGSNLDLGGDTSFVFHAFTITQCMDIAVAYCGTATQPAIYQAVLSLDCPMDANLINFSSGNFTDCSDGNATIFWTAVPAGTYYLPVRGEPATAGPYTITVSGTACPTPPPGDDCGGALALTSSTSCVGTPFFTTGATESLPAIDCGGFTSPNAFDVWFSFVCTSATQTIAVVGPNEADAMVELFEGNCASPTSLACADATFPQAAGETTTEQLIQTGLTVGNTYYVRVYDWGHASPDHYFEICVTEGSGTNIGIEENATAADWSIYPNPGTGVFNLQYNGANTATSIEVFDLTGRVVYTERTSLAAGTNHAIDLSGVAAGNYNVRLTANGVRTEQRLAVK